MAPGKLTEKTFNELVKLVNEHLTLHPSCIIQRFQFNGRVQKEGETIVDFVASLRMLAEFCEFGDTLEEMLRDHIVCGIRDSAVVRHLLAEPNLTVAKAFETVQAAKLAEKNVVVLQAQKLERSEVPMVNIVELNAVGVEKPPSPHWTGGKHNSTKWPCIEWLCFKYGEKGPCGESLP